MPVPPLTIGNVPVTLLVKSMDPASMLLVTFPAPMVVALPVLVISPVKLAFVVTVAAFPSIFKLATGVVEVTEKGAVPVAMLETICPEKD